MKRNLIDYLTVNSLIEVNNIITGSNNISLTKFNIRI